MSAPQISHIWIRVKRDVEKALRAGEALSAAWVSAGGTIAEQFDPSVQLVVCLSGDGTLLATIQEMGESRWTIPVLAIHGSHGLGFLHALSIPDFPFETSSKNAPDAPSASGKDVLAVWATQVVAAIRSGQYHLENRWGLLCRVHSSAKSSQEFWAFNDIVVAKGNLSRMVSLQVRVDGQRLMDRARGDGMIFSSASGSTAYSMSAGGPVVEPGLAALLLTPICLHRLTQRSLLLSSERKVEVEVLEQSASAFLTVDGQSGFELSPGQTFEVRVASQPVRWMALDRTGVEAFRYVEVLQAKLGYGA